MKDQYKQELVLQLPGNSIKDYDAMIELENGIIGAIGELGKVDGHDMGVGETNIFIHTNKPTATFKRIRATPSTNDFMPEMKAAYRKIGGDDFTIVYPPGLTKFTIA